MGRLMQIKGVAQLFRAWSLFEHMMPGIATLVLVGAGPEEANLKHLASSLGLKSVFFQGQVEYSDIARYYASADVFIMPTLEDNWSLVVPEAMACGLPVLTSRYNGCWSELIHPDKNGWVFDSYDPHDVLRCLEDCVKRQSDLAHMGQYSKMIVSRHTPNSAAQAILEACDIALGDWSRR
jgi:glycosyltransferase involved in cell wall biosynthesis